MKDSSYPSAINLLAENKFVSNQGDLANTEIPVLRIKGNLDEKINEIENKMQSEISDLKAKIKIEFKAIEEITEKIKSYEK